MLRLALATAAETLSRLREPLAERGIEAVHVTTEGRALPLADPPADFEGFDVGFVYPTRVLEGAVADRFLGVPWVNDRDAVLASRNKAGTLARLADAGLPTPETVLVSSPADDATLREAFGHVGPPVVVKPNSTTRGVGVARADDLDSFLGLCDYLDLVHAFRATADKSFLVQAFLPDARDYRVMVVDGTYAGAVERRLPDGAVEQRPPDGPVEHRPPDGAVERRQPDGAADDGTDDHGVTGDRWVHNVHRDAVAEGVDLPDDLRDLAERTAHVLDIPFLGVDLLVAEGGDGPAVVSETAARPTVDDAEKYEPDFDDRLAALIRETAGQA